jgi:hypothetical protein
MIICSTPTPRSVQASLRSILGAREVIHHRSQGSFPLISQKPSSFSSGVGTLGCSAKSFRDKKHEREVCSPQGLGRSRPRFRNKRRFSRLPVSKTSSSRDSQSLSGSNEYIKTQLELFNICKPELLNMYEGKFVWFENGNILDKGDSRLEIVERAYKKCDELRPLFIEKVSREETSYEVLTPFKVSKK